MPGGTVVVVVGGTVVVVVGGTVVVVGGSVAAVVVSGGAAEGAPPEPDVAKAIPPMAISATTIPVTMGSGLRLKGKPCSPNQVRARSTAPFSYHPSPGRKCGPAAFAVCTSCIGAF